MARPKEFDPAVALDVAMRLFWAKGYEATSTAELVKATGVARASLYATFGSKRHLYLTCLDHYLTGGASLLPEQLVAGHDDPWEALMLLLAPPTQDDDGDAGDAGAGGRVSGCFSVNATVEHAHADPEVDQRLEANRRRLEDALRHQLQRARREGTLRRDVDPSAAARTLLVLSTGLLALDRAPGQAPRAAEVLETAVGLLRTAAPVVP